MTGPDTSATLLSNKLSLVTHHHLLTRVLVKIDLENCNYDSWEYFFDQLCQGYEVSKYIHGPADEATTSTTTPLTLEERKVDNIILLWIFTTLLDEPQARLVVKQPRSTNQAWDLITDLVNDNKQSHTIALKKELRSLKRGDMSINVEDVVNFALEGFPDKYDHVCGIIHHRDSFPDLKTARSMLTTKEIRLKSKYLSLPVDSSASSPMILMAKSCTTRCPSTSQVKSWSTLGINNNGNWATTGPNTTPSISIVVTLDVTPVDPRLPRVRRPLYLMLLLLGHFMILLLAPGTWTQFVRDNNCTVKFGAFGFSVMEFMTCGVLLRYDSTGYLYPVMAPSPIPHAFLLKKPPVLCHAFQLGKHVRLSFVSSDNVVNSCFDIIHSDVWTSSIPILSVSPLPKSYRDAFNDPNWQNVMCDEYNALIKNNTWTLVPRPTDTNIVRCMWLFRHKYLADGMLSRYKAHIVANGSIQIDGVDVDETLSPIVKPGTIRTVLSLAASRHWPIHQLDGMDTAYLLLYVDDIWQYAVEILKRAHMVNCNPSRTPVDTESKLGDDVQQICLYMHDPRKPHLSASKRILRYVHGTFDYGLQLFTSSTASLVAYSDADWAGCPTTRQSTFEAEYRGVANAVAETYLLRNLLRELHTPLSFATLVYCDNVSAMYLSCNPVQHQRMKNIEIDIHFVCDLVVAGHVRVLHVPSRYQYADIFAKGLPFTLFEEFRTSLSVRCPPAPTAGSVSLELDLELAPTCIIDCDLEFLEITTFASSLQHHRESCHLVNLVTSGPTCSYFSLVLKAIELSPLECFILNT
ncbi:ribonuclease H-like domain-containing protein [Tanacetum coccineum]